VSGGALNSTQTKPNFGVPFPLRDPGSCQCSVAFLSSSLCIATACDYWSKINEMKMKYTVYWNHASLPAKRHLDQSTRFTSRFTSRRYACAVFGKSCVCLNVCPAVRLSQASIASKRLDESSWFWHGGFLRLIPHCIVRKFEYLRK